MKNKPFQGAPLLYVLVDSLPIGLYVKDMQGRFILVNRSMVRMIGAAAPDELLGKTVFDLCPQEDAEKQHHDELVMIQSGQSMMKCTSRYLDAAGNARQILITQVPMRNRQNKILGFGGMCQDAADDRKPGNGQSSEGHLLDVLLNHLPDAIYFKDSECRFIRNSKAHAERWFGLSDANQLVGKSDFDFFSEEHALRAYKDEQNIIKTKKPLIGIEEKETFPDGRVRWASTTKMPLYDQAGNVIGTFGISRDITKQKCDEQKIKDIMETLQRSNAEMEQLAFLTSHDLQEPLRMLSSYASLLEKRNEGILDSDSKEFLRYIAENARHMHQLIDDLRMYLQVVHPGRSFKSTNSEKVLLRIMRKLNIAGEGAKAKVTHDLLPTIMMDGIQFEQLLQNLIENAIKYSRNRMPEVHVSAVEKEDEWVFSVRDNGIGIDPKYHNQIFGMFKRLHARDQYSGTGMGLALCKKIVEQHGGRIWLESEVGKGSTFYFTMRGANA